MSPSRFVLDKATQERAVERALALVAEVFGDENVRIETHGCLYTNCALQLVLAREFGLRTMLQAGSTQWPMVAPEEDDGVSATHFSYQWEPNSLATRVNLAQVAFPEMHVWLGYRDRGHDGLIIDATTGSWSKRARLAGHNWTAKEPPRFLWADLQELERLSQERGLAVVYNASLDACHVADAFAHHGIYPRVAKALGLED